MCTFCDVFLFIVYIVIGCCVVNCYKYVRKVKMYKPDVLFYLVFFFAYSVHDVVLKHLRRVHMDAFETIRSQRMGKYLFVSLSP